MRQPTKRLENPTEPIGRPQGGVLYIVQKFRARRWHNLMITNDGKAAFALKEAIGEKVRVVEDRGSRSV